jgi:L-cystine uptake protein TcyP (sodium:dicarboxylate symporter family)
MTDLMPLLKPIYSWLMFILLLVNMIVLPLVGIAVIGACAEIEKWCKRR